MTDEQRIKIGNLRNAGLGYKKIAELMELSENTVKTYCKRHGLGGNRAYRKKADDSGMPLCIGCGKPVKQNPGRKVKKFCSDKCRTTWWNAHLDRVKRKAIYDFECAYCKKTFTVYGNAHRKYCCHECYIFDRFGGGPCD